MSKLKQFKTGKTGRTEICKKERKSKRKKENSNLETGKPQHTKSFEENTIPTKISKANISSVPELEAIKNELKNVNHISKRQKKKEKFKEIERTKKLKNNISLQQEALKYLSLWKYNRDDWKFKKMTQVWLVKHIFDDMIPKKYWKIATEYFYSSKGKVRQDILHVCTKLIQKCESEQSEMNEMKYERARCLLQLLEE